MENIRYSYPSSNGEQEMEMICVPGTKGVPYLFGADAVQLPVEVNDFYIGKFPVTQSFWKHVTGETVNRSIVQGDHHPVQNVTWYDITKSGGFLDKINALNIVPGTQMRFRLPSETEWEYAARGGPHWRDGFTFSGSNDIETVGWYKHNNPDTMQPVAQKAPNQLGIYDMSGNQWEWCQDLFTRDINRIPKDGSAYEQSGTDRVLRGGCFHNWAIHCTVSKRYEIGPEFGDGCISFRLVLSKLKNNEQYRTE